MRVWIDLANSPHVPLFVPIVAELEARGWDVLLTARNHAQTAQLARRQWPEVEVIGDESPPGRLPKVLSLVERTRALRRKALLWRPDAALSHGSYAQVLAANAVGIPAVTMMDYEYQPANHLSFRLAKRVLVPETFPARRLVRFGARPSKVARYSGFKEELYLAGFQPDPKVLDDLGLDQSQILAVFRPPPRGALYHRGENERFDEILEEACARPGVRPVVLARTPEQSARIDARRAIVPAAPIDGQSLLALSDLLVGAGGTMNREGALLGVPTYTVFGGKLAAVDQELIRQGVLIDLRASGSPNFCKKRVRDEPAVPLERRRALLDAVVAALTEVGLVPRRSLRARR
jgi:uncharacterized protein